MPQHSTNILDTLTAAQDSISAAGEVIADAPVEGMNPNLLLAMVGGVIILGFIAEFIFKVAKIPSVVKLMGVGLLLGPVFGVVDGDALREIAPIFGKIALLIILFAGGLKLDFQTVIQQLGKAVLLAVVAFAVTVGLTLPIGLYYMELEVLPAVILSFLIAGTASSIVIPVVTKLSVSNSTKTLLSIESALSNLFILILVVIACGISLEEPNAGTIAFDFIIKILVSLGSAVFAGVLWARLMGFMGQESLSYMLTLGFIFVLNFLVDRLGGSGAISILFFGVVLANVSSIIDRAGPTLRKRLGIKVDAADYLLNEFIKGIAGELSFLVATFFFCYLGILVSFDDFNTEMAIVIGLLIAAMILGRLLTLYLLRGFKRIRAKGPEFMIMLAMMPRGLATAVMAFEPSAPKYEGNIPGTEKFPFFAMIAILGTNLVMTAFVAIGENGLKRLRKANGEEKEGTKEQVPEVLEEPQLGTTLDATIPPVNEEQEPVEEPGEELSGTRQRILNFEEAMRPVVLDRTEEEHFKPFSERLKEWLRFPKDALILMDKNAVRSLKMGEVTWWIMVVATAGFATLGILMGRPEILLAAMMFAPIPSLVHTVALAVSTGDVFMFLKGQVKVITAMFVTFGIAAIISVVTPYTGIPEGSLERLTPTILDYQLSLFLGMLLPIVVIRARKIENLILTPLLALMMVPPIVRMGYEVGAGHNSANMLNALLAFAASFTALMLGAILTQFALGLTKHPASDFIKQWKEQEVEHGSLHKIFERLRLVRFLEYVGNFYARITVLAILAIALFVPLQMTINNLNRDFTISTTVQGLANDHFEIVERAGILSIHTDYRKDEGVFSTVRIHTESYFTYEDIQKFEREASIAVGMPVTLRLIQTRSEINAASTTALEPTGFGQEQDLPSSLMGLQTELEGLGSSLPGAKEIGLQVLGFRTDFVHGGTSPEIVVEYLKDEPLNHDAEVLLAADISGRMGIPAAQIGFEWLPPSFHADRDAALDQVHSPDDFSNEFGSELADYLSHPAIQHVVLKIPKKWNSDSLQKVISPLLHSHPAFDDPKRTEVKIVETGLIAVEIR